MDRTRNYRLATCTLGALVWLVAAAAASAWDGTGHRIVARIAWDRLPATVRAEVTTLVGSLGVDFVESSVWLDEVRAAGVHLFDRWHYINQSTAASTVRAPRAHADNVLWAIAAAREGLAARNAPQHARALALVTLIHLVGDVHQPLHVVARFNDQHPRGDRGGNSFEFAGPWQNLHRLWDGMGGLIRSPADGHRPDADAILSWARKLPPVYPADPRQAAALDPNAWADEGRRLADDVVYRGIDQDKVPAEAYLKRAQQVSGERVVLAGARLAALIEAALIDAALIDVALIDVAPSGPSAP